VRWFLKGVGMSSWPIDRVGGIAKTHLVLTSADLKTKPPIERSFLCRFLARLLGSLTDIYEISFRYPRDIYYGTGNVLYYRHVVPASKTKVMTRCVFGAPPHILVVRIASRHPANASQTNKKFICPFIVFDWMAYRFLVIFIEVIQGLLSWC